MNVRNQPVLANIPIEPMSWSHLPHTKNKLKKNCNTIITTEFIAVEHLETTWNVAGHNQYHTTELAALASPFKAHMLEIQRRYTNAGRSE